MAWQEGRSDEELPWDLRQRRAENIADHMIMLRQLEKEGHSYSRLFWELRFLESTMAHVIRDKNHDDKWDVLVNEFKNIASANKKEFSGLKNDDMAMEHLFMTYSKVKKYLFDQMERAGLFGITESEEENL